MDVPEIYNCEMALGVLITIVVSLSNSIPTYMAIGRTVSVIWNALDLY